MVCPVEDENGTAYKHKRDSPIDTVMYHYHQILISINCCQLQEFYIFIRSGPKYSMIWKNNLLMSLVGKPEFHIKERDC